MIDLPPILKRPLTHGQARELIADTYELGNMDRLDQRVFENMLGLELKPVESRSEQDLRTIIDEMKNRRWIKPK